jgi:thiol-disulfide isomerase/thioredoxin
MSLRRHLPLALAAVVLLGACSSTTVEPAADTAGASTPSATPSPPASAGPSKKSGTAGAEPTQQPVVASDLPDVSVIDVATGRQVALPSVVDGKRHLLVWAWAPHCPICAGEAPGVEAFASQNGGDVDVVGLGTQDTLGLAETFVASYGVKTPLMLWDPGFDSWRDLRITSQPTWILLSPQGKEIDRWTGALPADAVLDKVRA